MPELGPYPLFLAAYFVEHCADMILTMRIIRGGGSEGNVMLAPLIEAPGVGLRRAMLIKMALALVSIAILGAIGPSVPSWMALFGLFLAYAYVVRHNWGQWQKQRERRRRRG